MKVTVPGHMYLLDHLDGTKTQQIHFVDRGHGHDQEGTTNQEVLRVLIDRVKFLDEELPWQGNEQILFHLRSALVLHEVRHLERIVEKGRLKPEEIQTGIDGHFLLIKQE